MDFGVTQGGRYKVPGLAVQARYVRTVFGFGLEVPRTRPVESRGRPAKGRRSHTRDGEGDPSRANKVCRKLVIERGPQPLSASGRGIGDNFGRAAVGSGSDHQPLGRLQLRGGTLSSVRRDVLQGMDFNSTRHVVQAAADVIIPTPGGPTPWRQLTEENVEWRSETTGKAATLAAGRKALQSFGTPSSLRADAPSGDTQPPVMEPPALWDEERQCYTVGGRTMPPGFRPSGLTKFNHVRAKVRCMCRRGGSQCSVVCHSLGLTLTAGGLLLCAQCHTCQEDGSFLCTCGCDGCSSMQTTHAREGPPTEMVRWSSWPRLSTWSQRWSRFSSIGIIITGLFMALNCAPNYAAFATGAIAEQLRIRLQSRLR